MKDGITLHPEHGLNPSIAGVISAVKDRLPNEDHKKMVFEILNDTKKEYGRYNNCGTKVL